MASQFQYWKPGIATKLAVYLVLGTGAVFLLFGLWNLKVHRAHAESLLTQDAAAIADLIQRSARYDMLRNDREALQRTIMDVGSEPGISVVRIYNRQGRISFSNNPAEIDTAIADPKPSSLALDRISIRILKDHRGERYIDLVRPIRNLQGCSSAACHEHPPSQKVLGAIDTHLSLASLDRELAAQQRHLARFTLLALGLIMLASVAFVFLVLHRRIRELKIGTKRVAGGDLSYRLPVRSADELSELAASFNLMTMGLDRANRELIERTQTSLIQSEKMASLGKLAATVAHELNNPLFGILTYARLALKHIKANHLPFEERDRLLEKLQVIERESRRSGEIVKNLLTFARQAPRKVSEHNLNVLVERAIAVVRHRLELQQVSIETHLDPDLPLLACDEGQMQQVLLVLLVNAAEAMPEGGSLRVVSGVRSESCELYLSVADTGVGIPRDVMAHIFEPFFTTKAEGQGSGLGLAIAHGIVAQHGGEIRVRSEAGLGAEFLLGFGLRKDASVEPNGEVVCEQR